ncbi:MAG: hypothetical protein JOY70_01765, partial [Acidisphaera sp.]|nr:hypothetical protein [Acidisphaera sp.]
MSVAQAQTVPPDDWRQDAPGRTLRIDPGSLPPPYATHSASEGPRVIARPEGAALRVPPGFVVAPFASGLEMPRVVRRAPNGDIFLAESGAGRIRVFPADATGPNAPSRVFASDLELPFGIAFWPPADPQYVYVAETARVVRYPYRSGDTAARGPAETVVPELPTGGHWTRDLATAPDGSRLFLSIGSQSNAGREIAQQPPGGVAAWQAAHGLGAAWGAEAERADVLTLDP